MKKIVYILFAVIFTFALSIFCVACDGCGNNNNKDDEKDNNQEQTSSVTNDELSGVFVLPEIPFK